MFKQILGKILNQFDPNLKNSYELLNKEINSGEGSFEKLLLPSELNFDINVIQYFKSHPTFNLVSGLGSDRNLETAYVKAIVEYFERLAFFENEHKLGLTSTNGIAAHPYLAMAKKMAMDEMFERDAFLRHWYTQTPFHKIDLSAKSKELKQNLERLNLDLILAVTHLGYQKVVCAFLLDLKSGGFALGLSSGRDKQDEDKAIFEAIINYFFGHGGKSKETLISELKNNEISSLEHHRSFWLYDQKFPDFMIATGDQMAPVQYPALKGKTEYHVLRDDKLKIVKMSNENLIELSVGDVTKSKVSLTKIDLNGLVGPFKYHPIP